MTNLAGRTILMSGGSRGIGLAIAVRAARDGANIAILAKTTAPHPKLDGTIHTAADEITSAGGQALPIAGDVRDEETVVSAVEQTVRRFGGIDIVVNNASAIDLSGSEDLSIKRFDLMQQVNVRGTFLLSRAAVPYLRSSTNPHVLSLSPPLDLEPKWFRDHPAYTISKYGMSMLVLGMGEEYRADGIAFNALWPRTLIATSAVRNVIGGDEAMRRSRKPEIMADAAHAMLVRDSRSFTGNFCLDDEVLAEAGMTDFGRYSYVDGIEPELDLFVRPS